MKKIILFTLLIFSVTCLAAKAAVNAGLSINSGGNSFYLSIGDYYSVPQSQVMVVKEQNIPDDEIPVVFYIARQAQVAPATIINLRLKGNSWLTISSRYGFGPEIFYVPINANVVVGPPYGHAYGFYKNKPKKDWKYIKLQDADIINLVNLKFMSEHYKYPPATIMKMRQHNKKFYAINADIEKQRKGNKKNEKAVAPKKAKAAPGQVKNNKSGGKQMKNDMKHAEKGKGSPKGNNGNKESHKK
ncbi:MAG: hypothetical protein WCX65_06015 [bacterium]